VTTKISKLFRIIKTAVGHIEKIYEIAPTPLQNFMLTCYGLKIYNERYGKRFRRLYQEMDRLQWCTRDEIEHYQIEKLRQIVRHAYLHVPFYRNYMNKEGIHYSDIKSLDSLKWFPVVRKSQIKAAPRLFRSEKKQYIIHGHTSGTTGSPFDIIYSRNVSTAMAVCDWRHMHNCGRKLNDRIAIFLGRIIVPLKQSKPPFWRYNLVHNEVWFSSFHLNAMNMRLYLKKIKQMGIRFIKAYPSTAYILARFCIENGMKIPMKAVLTSSETLFVHQKECIEKAFCCKVYDYYGHAERVLFATECEYHNGLHVNEDFGIVECLDQNGNQVREGEPGMLVGTSLFNLALPFIRYETGDMSNIITKQCSCGRIFKRMSAVTTKAEDIILTPDGRMISSSILTHPFKPIDTIEESQIIQDKLDHVTVKLVVNSGFTSDHQYSPICTRMFKKTYRLGYKKMRLSLPEKIPYFGMCGKLFFSNVVLGI